MHSGVGFSPVRILPQHEHGSGRSPVSGRALEPSNPPIGPALMPDLARTSIALYFQTADFTALHMVWAAHAARVLFARFPSLASNGAISALWRAACAAYASIGAPIVTDPSLNSRAIHGGDHRTRGHQQRQSCDQDEAHLPLRSCPLPQPACRHAAAAPL